MSFPDFTRKRLFEPLGMKTTMSPSDLRDVIKNRANGYEKQGNGWRVGMYVGNERGSGGGAVLSTASDLLIWNDALTSAHLGAFVTEKLQEQARLNNGRKLRYARGLMINPFPGGTLVSHFLSQDQFELKSMEGQTTRDARAQPYAPTAVELQAFAGRYTSDEAGSAFQVVPGKGGLVVHLEGSSGKGSEIRPVSRDTFQVSRVTVRFLRDKDGKVVAFDYSNPLVRNIKFTRASR
jgi:CubicO group peptidase (beta-lactamase class C family)